MIDILKRLENEQILGLLSNRDNFKSLNIDYHPPRVERIWTQVGENRLCFHYIHPCETEEALYHPHPWASAIHQIEGEYEMGVTLSNNPCFFENNNTGKWKDRLNELEACKIISKGDLYYEMMNRDGFHYVRPISLCKSVMLMGPLFDSKNKIKNPPTKQLLPLNEERIEEIRLWFYDWYAKQ